MNKKKIFAIDIDGTLTENGNGIVHLPALHLFRILEKLGHHVIYVTGRSSIEAYVLAVFGGTTKIAVGENGGVITTGPTDHILLANKDECINGFNFLKEHIHNIKIKNVFNRMTEVVLERNFDIKKGQEIFDKNNIDLYLNDSKYAYHINKIGVNKGKGITKISEMLNIPLKEIIAIGDSETDIPMFDICGYSIALNHADNNVKRRAKHVVSGNSGIGLVEALEFSTKNILSEL